MARRVNYGFAKRQRELKKQKKNEEKAERRRLEQEARAAGAVAQDSTDGEEAGAEPAGSEEPDLG